MNENDLRAGPAGGDGRANSRNATTGHCQVVDNRIVLADASGQSLAKLSEFLFVALRLGIGIWCQVECITAAIEAGQIM